MNYSTRTRTYTFDVSKFIFMALAAWVLGNVIKVDDGWDYISIWFALFLAQCELSFTWRK